MIHRRYTIRHQPGYSPIDHVGPEFVQMAQRELEGRPDTRRSAEAACRRAARTARRLAQRAPQAYGVFRGTLPRLVVDETSAPRPGRARLN